MERYILHGTPGWGSAIVEAQLDFLGLPYDYIVAGDLFASAEAREQLAKVNPLAQVPALVLPDGRVMTESAAITLHLADATRRDDFVPRPDEAARAPFLRWLVYLVANVYPTFTYADDPQRFVADKAASEAFAEKLAGYKKRLWSIVEPDAGAPWFLGDRFSALDVYVGVMTRWRPGREWFAANAPKLAAIAKAVDAMPQFQACWKRNFER